jgi:glycosyltransferase involved in cell wall biosynthesis
VNVVILAKAFPPNIGGVETVSEEIAAAYARAGADVRVITQFDGPAGAKSRTIRGGTFCVHNVGPGPQPVVFFRMTRLLLRLLSEKPADITHATTWRVLLPLIVAGGLGKKIGKRIVMVHGREVLQTHGVMAALMQLAFRFADRALIISAFAQSACGKKLAALRRIGVVSWNGISWPDEPAKSDYEIDASGAVRLLASSQHTARKNIGAAIRAVCILSERHMNVRLTIAGDGPERRNLERFCVSLGLGEKVTFLGKLDRNTLPRHYKSADIFVHPHSHSHDVTDVESFCIAVADGMALGVPVISGRDGAPSEYIRDGINGFLVKGDDPVEIADTIERIATMTASQRAEIGRSAAKFCADSFSWDRHILPALQLAEDRVPATRR